MKKILLAALAIALLGSCKKQTCYDCLHGLNSQYAVHVCAEEWGPSPTGGMQTPPGQTYPNYNNCY